MNSLAKTIGLAVAVLLMGSAASMAQDQCPRGQLDARYCDANGDLVADAPTNAADWLDPDTLVFTYTPAEDPAVYTAVWADFLSYMKEATGKKVVYFPVESNAAQIEAMRSGRLHIAGFNTGAVPLAVNCAGFSPFALMAAKDDTYGVQMEIITYPGSGVETPADLKGKKLAFTAPTSNSGYKAPAAILLSEFGLKEGTDYEPVFSGKYDNSILGVANKDYIAAAVANSVLHRIIARGDVKADQVKSIYTSQTFPPPAFGVSNRIAPELAAKIRDAFFSFDWNGTSLQKEFEKSGSDKFLPITYKDGWDVIRKIDAANGDTYSCN